ncbi:hypothetical protein B0H19DRAFT_1259112 [Mycena capillaripes]|nr:hypothetical protein B0H19DRAFT_1259112 [Mycena capillaripes]
MSLTTTIEDLPEDVLIRTLGFCDICSVLSVSQANRYLQRIALVKQIWIFLVQNLIDHSLLELPPGFIVNQYSSAELLEHLKRVVNGPRTWTSTDTLAATPSATVVVPANVSKSQGYRGDSKVKLVNGGRQIVVVHRAAVQIWDVRTKRQLWSRPVFALSFDCDPRNSEDNIALAMTLTDRLTVEIAQIDMQLGETQIFNLQLPAFHADADPIISGNLLVVHMRVNAIGGYETLVVDWLTSRYVLLSGFRGSSVPCVGIIAGKYLVVVGDIEYRSKSPDQPYPPPLFRTHILVYSTAIFDPHWSPLSDLRSTIQRRTTLPTLMPLVFETPKFEDEYFHDASSILTIHESPLRPGVFRLRVYLSDGRVRKSSRQRVHVPAAVFCYSCNGGSGDHAWRLESTRATLPLMPFHEFSYAGHAVEDRKYDVYDIARINPSRKPLVSAPPRSLWQHLSPYSGVVTTLMPEEVLVAYYE